MYKTRKHKLKIFLILIVSFFLIFGFNGNKIQAEDDKLIVSVGITPLKNFAQEIGGENIEVSVMVPPGYSPANYAPSPSEMRKLSEADIYLSLGMPTERSNILPKLNNFNDKIDLLRLDKLVNEKYSARKFSNGGVDPHIWLSPNRAKYMVEMITEKFIELAPEHKTYFKNRSKNYLKRLNELDNYISKKLNELNGKYIIIYHPVLGYLTEEYGLEMQAIEKNGKKATPKRLAEIINLAKNEKIKTIFHQSTIDSKQTQVIANEIKGKTVQINPLSDNYIKNMKRIADLIAKSYE